MYQVYFEVVPELKGMYPTLEQVRDTCAYFQSGAQVFDGLVRVCSYGPEGTIQGTNNLITNFFHEERLDLLSEEELVKRSIDVEKALQLIECGRVSVEPDYELGWLDYVQRVLVEIAIRKGCNE